MMYPGGLRFDRQGSAPALSQFGPSRAYGTISFGQFINFQAIQIGKVFYTTQDVPFQTKGVLRQLARRAGVRIVDLKEQAAIGAATIQGTDTESLIQGEDAQQAELLRQLALMNPNRPPENFWSTMEKVNQAWLMAGGVGNPVDVLLQYKNVYENPNSEENIDILNETWKFLNRSVEVITRLF